MASLINQSPRLNLGQIPRLHHSSSSTSLSNNKTFIFKPSWFLVLFLLSISLFTFFLQWRNGGIDPMTRLANFAPLNSPETGCATQVLGPKSLAPVSSVFSSWKFYNETHVSPKICITSTTSAGLEEILPWIFFHKVVGITHFFLFVEGKAASPNVAIVLESIPGVKVLPRTKELEAKQAKSRIWNESWLSDAFHKPCNSALFVKQTLNMEMAIAMARDAGMEWIIHLDTDELLHPAGTTEYSVRQLLAKVPGEVDAVVFVNYEGAVETADIKDPFSEVSLFKRNYAHLPNDTNFDLYEMATRGNPYYFLTYANGKSAARIQDNLRPNGAHRWYNYFKEPKEIDLNEAVVLHYTYAKFSSLTSRRNRCNCQPTEQDVKRCFWLEFDRQAFIVASTETKENMLQWYKDHVVWDNEEMNLKLLKYGVFTRIYTPMVIIQNLQESGILTSIITTARAPST